MQRYVRLAGIDEGNATERLKFIPTEQAVMEKVVNLISRRNRGIWMRWRSQGPQFIDNFCRSVEKLKGCMVQPDNLYW